MFMYENDQSFLNIPLVGPSNLFSNCIMLPPAAPRTLLLTANLGFEISLSSVLIYESGAVKG